VKPGRPKKQRVPGSGDKLRRALEILGLTWGKCHTTSHHVLQDERWLQCNLPKSVNTIAEDMKIGVPLARMASYAAFLNIPIELFQDDSISCHSVDFLRAVFAAREESAARNLPFLRSYNKLFFQHFYAYNNNAYITALFDLLRGVYATSTVFSPSNEIHNGCALIDTVEEHSLRAEAFMLFRDTEILYEATIFRWGSNLHISYYSQDMYIFGRLLAEDPLRHFALAHKNPFSLAMAGVADSLIGPQTFDLVHTRAERIDRSPGPDLRDGFAKACREVRKRPTVFPADPDHAHLLGQVLADGQTGPQRA